MDNQNQNKMQEEDYKKQEEAKTKKKPSTTPFLDDFGRDLSKQAKDGLINPVIGREKEVNDVMMVLSRKTKNNVVLVGEPGVGKTAIVEGIAIRLEKKDCPDNLIGMRIVELDMASLRAGASAMGDIEMRVKSLLKELEENPEVILFIDELHTMVDKHSPVDVSNMVKPALARGQMRLIGATTFKEYKNSFEKDGALERRVQKVIVEEPSLEDTLNILNKTKHYFEDFHNVFYPDEVINACIKLGDRYIKNRFFPDKAIDLIDEAGSKAKLFSPDKLKAPEEIGVLEAELQRIRDEKNALLKQQEYQRASDAREIEKSVLAKLETFRGEFEAFKKKNKITITVSDIEALVASKTGIPIERLGVEEIKKLLVLEETLGSEVIGQEDAVKRVSKCIRRSRSGIKDPNRPMGVFMFLGSTGTGKTHLAKMVAKNVFGAEGDMIRFDMSEFSAPHTVSRLIGAPPSYVGYGEGGQLTEAVRKKPYSLILLDEMEKAHPIVLTSLLQVFDEGHLTDAEGRKVDFKNTIIMMTSNIGSNVIQNLNDMKPVGFKDTSDLSDSDKIKRGIRKELKRRLAPEFINRIDDIVVFNPLSKDDVYNIIDLELGKLSKRLLATSVGYRLECTEGVKDILIEYGFDKELGARPMRRAIQTIIEDPISEEIIRGNIEKNILMDYDKETGLSINGILVEDLDLDSIMVSEND